MASVWGELKRRKVVKVAVAYAVVGWLLVEVAATVLPIFEAPDWILQVFTLFVILGFPLTLVLSWVFDLTTSGVERTAPEPGPGSAATMAGRKLDFAIIGALVLALGLVVYNYVLVDNEGVGGVLPNSVAVLPFENLSPDPDNAYFAAGIHEEILNQLVKLRNLSVISRTSVLRYADSELSIPEIAQELNVATVMEGSVRYAGDRVRIAAQLIDAETDEHLWSEGYERDFADIFGIQTDIAMNVANALQATFSPAEQESIEQVPTDSPEAYALYLRALSESSGDLRFQLLDEALALDPNFALAYAFKASSYARAIIDTSAGTADPRPATELAALAMENAERALALDETIGQAHAALALLHRHHWRWPEAQRAYARAYELSPNDIGLLWNYGWFSSFTGQYDRALTLAERRIELDPAEGIAIRDFVWPFLLTGRYEQARNAAQQCVAADPASSTCNILLAWAELLLGNPEEAVGVARRDEALFPDRTTPMSLAVEANIYGAAGQHEDALRLFQRLQEVATQRAVDPGTWASAYLAIGDEERAYEWLNTAVLKAENQEADAAFYNMVFIKLNIIRNPVLERPRFVALRNRIGALDPAD